MAILKLKVETVKKPDQSYTNCVFVNTNTMYKMIKSEYVKINSIPFKVKLGDEVQNGYMAFNKLQRTVLKLGLNEEINVYIDPDITIEKRVSITMIVDYFVKPTQLAKRSFNRADLELTIRQSINNIIMSNRSKLLIDFHGVNLTLAINGPIEDEKLFQLDNQTLLILTAFSLKFDDEVAQLFKGTLNLSNLMIGGLDDQFTEIFRRAFASRALPPKIIDALGIKHVKGILLYGKPGCGKTLLAREIGKILQCNAPKIVQGPSLLNKYVGESEANVRALFDDAKKKPDELHLIICDEFDALCKQRGSGGSSGDVNDKIVNQFLAMIDGPDELSNILLICMTNRKDLIDDAMLRPGRLELQICIPLPDCKGRRDILAIHTKKIRDNQLMEPNVNLDELANNSVNFTGAEIEGLVKSAVSYAISREIDVNNINENKKNIQPIVTVSDFDRAFNDVKPMFGNISEEINQYLKTPFLVWGDLQSLINEMKLYIKNLKNGNVLSMVLTGSANTGKTKLLSMIANESDITCIKMITPTKLLSIGDKANHIMMEFDNCLTAESSILILDNLERIIEWSSYTSAYNNRTLQMIMTLIRRQIDQNKKMIVLFTCYSEDFLRKLDLNDLIDHQFNVPESMTRNDAKILCEELNTSMSLMYSPDTIEDIFVKDFFKKVKTVCS